MAPEKTDPNGFAGHPGPDAPQSGSRRTAGDPSATARRPVRLKITDELGRPRTLDAGPASFSLPERTTRDAPLVFLGLGPDPETARRLVAEATPETGPEDIFWLECPAFEARMPSCWRAPSAWARLTPEKLLDLAYKRRLRFIRYLPGARLFPSFWGPLLGSLEALRLDAGRSQASSRRILTPGGGGDLLTHELEAAIAESGFLPWRIAPDAPLAPLLREERPALFLSVNLRGLDAEGAGFRLLQACGVPVAVWCVDNPWHLLSGLRQPWWKEASLFVTDASFIDPLRRHGASFVRHLPLGAWMQPKDAPLFSPCLAPVVFVGRSAFPDRDRFFAGCRLPENAWQEATARLRHGDSGHLPHVHWWEERLGIASCWPGSAIRRAGLGAERCSALRRALWLRAAGLLGLTVFGDGAWKALLPPGSDVRPPLDYYHGLLDIYASARYSLNVTSLLLPCGLTQRHFDVWTAGGFLFSDATPGLSIFPKELVRPIALAHPDDLAGRIEAFEKDPGLRPQLAKAWKDCLTMRHSYTVRMQTLLRELQLI